MNEKELVDFANWLWDMNKLIVNQHLPPFENAEYWARQYIKVKKLNTRPDSPSLIDKIKETAFGDGSAQERMEDIKALFVNFTY
jgi:hypothetical protein